MDASQLYRQSVQEFKSRAALIRADQWHLPTPCSEWNVKALVAHIVREDLWVPPLVMGQTIAQVGSRFDKDVLGDMPVVDYENASAAAVAAFEQPGALEFTVHLSYGDVTGKDYATQMFMDHLIHAWDLARAISATEKFDAELVSAAYSEMLKQADSWRAGGLFGPAILVSDLAPPLTKLLALTGRQV